MLFYKIVFPLANRTCEECGKEYQPTSNVQKYCNECRVIIKRRKGTENKRRYREKLKQEKIKESA